MKKRRLFFAVAAILLAASLAAVLSSCINISVKEPQTRESAGTDTAADAKTDPAEQATEPAIGPSTEPADTTPAITPDPDGDAAAYADFSQKAENDVIFRFIKAYIDGDGRTVAQLGGFADRDASDEWIIAFRKYRNSFRITRCSAVVEATFNEYGCGEEKVRFTFSVYESENDAVPVGEYEKMLVTSDLFPEVSMSDPAISEKNSVLWTEFPEVTGLVLRMIPCYDTIAGGYTDEWTRNSRILDMVVPSETGMTADQINEAANELFGIDSFNLTGPAGFMYLGDDGLYHVGGHGGGSSGVYELLSAEKDGDGVIARIRLFADNSYFIPSDEFEVRVKPSDGYFRWVYDYVKIIRTGEIPPYFFGGV